MTTAQTAQQQKKQSTAIVAPEQQKLNNLRGMFDRAKGGLAAVLPKHLPAEKVIRLVLSAASRTPELLDCTPESVLLSSMQAAALGLEPNTPLGLAYLVPYNTKKKDGNREYWVKECQFIPGYRGLITLAIQSGDVRSVQADVVYKDDLFEYERGLEPKLRHIPNLDGDQNEADIVAFYSVAVFTNGARTFDVMTKAQVDKIRKRSKAGDWGPWKTDYVEMGKKTVIRRHAKGLPLSPEKSEGFSRALVHQGRAEQGEGPDYADMINVLPAEQAAAQLPAPSDGGAMKDRLAAKAAEAEQKPTVETTGEPLAQEEPGANG